MVSMPSLRESVSLKSWRCPFGKASNMGPRPTITTGRWFPAALFYRVEHKCGHEGCGLPHVLFLKSWRYLTDKTVERKALSAMPRTRCAEGYEFGPSFEFENVREVFTEPLPRTEVTKKIWAHIKKHKLQRLLLLYAQWPEMDCLHQKCGRTGFKVTTEVLLRPGDVAPPASQGGRSRGRVSELRARMHGDTAFLGT
jgi:hypothetical protein